MTSVHCTAAASANAAFPDRNRATASVDDERDRVLQRARAEPQQQHLGERDAERHRDDGLEHPHRPGVAHEAERVDRDDRRDERLPVAEHEVRERVGGHRGHRDLQDRREASRATRSAPARQARGDPAARRSRRTPSLGSRGTSTAAPASAGTISTCAAATSMPWLSTMSSSVAGTARFTTASAIGPELVVHRRAT